MKTFFTHPLRTVLVFMTVGVLFSVIYFTNPSLFKILNVQAGATQNVSGWTWSETVGWMSFNSFGCDSDKNGFTDIGICGGDNTSTVAQDYGVSVGTGNKATGLTDNFSGSAWSDNVGWVSFDRTKTGNPPAAPFNGGSGPIAQVDWSTGNVTGWMRALSACQSNLVNGSGNCTGSGAGDAAGGWDGWIKLSDDTNLNWTKGGVKILANKFSGYAWGGNVTSSAATVQTFADISSTASNPYDIIFDNVGNLYSANFGSDNVSKTAPNGIITTINLIPSGCSGPSAITFGSLGAAGDLYVACYNSKTVSKITPAGSVSLFANLAPSGGLGPMDITFNSINGNFYTANSTTLSFSSNVSQITPVGTATVFASTTSIGSLPRSVVVDTVGNLYVAFYGGNKIAKITLTGTPSMFADLAPGGFGSFGPFALVFDAAGNLYSANYGSSDISKITFSSPGVLLQVTQFSDFSAIGTGPRSLTFDVTHDNLYAASFDTSNIIKIDSMGNASVYATLPLDSTPRGIAIDATGKVYTADQWAYSPNPAPATISKVIPGISDDASVIGWVDFAPKIGGVSVGPIIGVPPCVAADVPASSWGACQPLVSCPTADTSGIQVGACPVGGTVTRSCTTPARVCTSAPAGPAGTCGDGVCNSGETPLTCAKDCKVKFKQF